jgi:DNA recombination protein RmuC
MDTTSAILVLVAVAVGAGIGWLFGSRPAADWKARHAQREEELKRAAGELGTAQIELATLRANAENFDKQLQQMKQAREDLLVQFKVAGGEVLTKAQEEFLKRAEEKFGHAEKASKEAVQALLQPVHERLKTYEDHVTSLEQKRASAFGELTGLITSMRDGQEQVRREAQRLGNSLTNAPKARGRWGERALQNLLEQCGLAEHTDFTLEHSIDTEDGRLRPDAIISVPGQKKLVIDAKVSLNAYQAAFEADDEDERRRQLEQHAKSMRGHVQTLGAKCYQSKFEEATDYVEMFVPGEHFVAAALEADPELWDFAFEKRVLLATPTNLVAICRTVAQVWRQDSLAREAQEIGRMGAELYERLRVAADHLKRVGGGLETAVNNYNKFVGSFERNVLSSGKRLAEKGVDIGRAEIPEVPLVESAPRYTGDDTEDGAAVRLVGGKDQEEAGEAG